MQFTSTQDAALQAVDKWFKEESHSKRVFKLFGVAGTGKSTLAKYFADHVAGTVKYAAFTGKAAHVMAKKGCAGASTIHQLIYRPKGKSKKTLYELEDKLNALKAEPEPNLELIAQVERALEEEHHKSGNMSFSLNLDSELQFAKLLILDEVSMINHETGKDLESFGIPILVLGDPEQLPPVFGNGYFTEGLPDIFLDEIHRQALDNPIIAMSKMVREGKPLPLGQYGTSRVINEKLENEDVLSHDIILTGLRKTKRACDIKARQLLNKGGHLPVVGDRLMCVKNNHDVGLLNGQIWIALSDAVPVGDGTVSLHIKEAEAENELVVSAAEKLFLGEPLSRWEHEEWVQEFEYAYAVTVHKSQGSQWDNVLLFDQKDRFPMWSDVDRRRWLYTGITRAAERVTVMR